MAVYIFWVKNKELTNQKTHLILKYVKEVTTMPDKEKAVCEEFDTLKTRKIHLLRGIHWWVNLEGELKEEFHDCGENITVERRLIG